MTKRERDKRYDAKRGSARQRGYDHRWAKCRALFLQKNPLCALHEQRGELVAASVVDHVKPHRGNAQLFWDEANWQSLCAPCHSSAKQSQERVGFSRQVGVDGWPIDPLHPANRS